MNQTLIKKVTMTVMLSALSLGAMTHMSLVQAQNIAVVNGKPIPKTRLDAMLKEISRSGQPVNDQMKDSVREELISREIMYQAALKYNAPKSPEVQNQIELAKQTIMIRAMVQEFMEKNKPTDQELKAEYEKIKQMAGDKEYRARHILVESEDEAKSLIEQLQKGAKFEELAKKSKDPGSAQNGGDLEWNVPSTFVPEFSNAMVALEKGKFTETPVKSQFGFHIIKLEDIREVKAPEFEQVKSQLLQELQRQKLQKLQADLRKNAKIQ